MRDLLLIRRLTGNRGAAFLAGLAYAFLPYRYAHLWHLQQLGHAWTPWVLLAFLALIVRPTWLRAALFGLLVATQVLTSFYLAFQIALVLVIAVVVAFIADQRARSPRFLGMLAASGLLAAIIIVPLTIPYFWVRDDQGLERTLAEIDVEHHWMATPRSYLTTEDKNWVWEWMSEPHNTENALFPGSIAIIGAVAGLAAWRAPARVHNRAGDPGGQRLRPLARPHLGAGQRRHNRAPLPLLLLLLPILQVDARPGPLRYSRRLRGRAAGRVRCRLGLGAAVAPLERERAPGRRGSALTVGLAALILIENRSRRRSRSRQIDSSPAVAAPYECLAAQRDNDR